MKSGCSQGKRKDEIRMTGNGYEWTKKQPRSRIRGFFTSGTIPALEKSAACRKARVAAGNRFLLVFRKISQTFRVESL